MGENEWGWEWEWERENGGILMGESAVMRIYILRSGELGW